ncbi:MAG: FKBP-type peptidyl-prolyl cis-trans isomerase [Ignavibacteriales bacterium]|nr:FKBP-type peptidyl-prolyl cis-trans isomerase [Ignavibacteriales bacterium]
MKSHLKIIGIFLLVPALLSSQGKEPIKSQKDKVSYSIGLDFGKNMKSQSVELNLDLLLRGIRDGLAEAAPALTDAEMREAMTTFQKEMMAKMQEKQKVSGEKNKKEGEAFLAENKKKPGIVTLPSGLQYKILKDGIGKSPKATDTVTVHYRGTLVSGKEFESSYKGGAPTTYPLKGFIPGWVEALQKMKVGSKWQLFVPSNLAYGENGPGDIGPNATLIFEVELLGAK